LEDVMSSQQDTSRTSTAGRIARAHLAADRAALSSGERLDVDQPVGYATGTVTLVDDLREVAGFTDAEVADLSDDELTEVHDAVIAAYRLLAADEA
jgi:hypothetical protein